MTKHPTETPEYWERLARSERAFATERHQTVESMQIHEANAERYEQKARKLREGN